ncbi:aldehyde dehydrogenase (NADP(+)) [Gluconacetobacter takamatsuzukensis]|uniref:Aldehyde dehydrogenase (NADP(+)) n=1 Tax=Gluconacetobacter takamatsuzukensis TaxID=1286190 RepID=A0A7W4PT28_9PROT|nr:aldehyde dehydrogenase (NADP(+)) [Gluconacetobacter takamatsuzukensis]MBB2205526.1 aldehyde dehydrogenase (NADP(+)) [Gluconacetobacter takamatsuzukensis]
MLPAPSAITGDLLIGFDTVRTDATFTATDPATGLPLPGLFSCAAAGHVQRAAALAARAFDPYRLRPVADRAAFLEAIADTIAALGDVLTDRACAETGLPRARIVGETARTTGQLRLFADLVRAGLDALPRLDGARPDRRPLPRADLRQGHVGLGPVAVFGAGNFPLAFSVAGGDTASALAAGCPVVARAHPAHPGTGELVGRAILHAARQCDMPEGVFSLLGGPDHAPGAQLVADPHIAAVGFTGSRAGGLALMRLAAARPVPIPVFAEMSSINPVYLLPGALANGAAEIAQGFAASLTAGSGQFCTNPGLLVAVEGPDLEAFVATAAARLAESPGAPMLTAGIHRAFDAGVRRLADTPGVSLLARGPHNDGPNRCRAALFRTDAQTFAAHPHLAEEVFGAVSLLVACPDMAAMQALTERLEGQLTATLWLAEDDLPAARALMPVLERKAGRILANGWPTGVEVCPAMVHGGPFPATSDGRSTSVGTGAIERFLRPVCYQDLPRALLPERLRDDAPSGRPCLRDGALVPA